MASNSSRKPLSRRQRKVVFTTVLAAVFVAGAGLAVWGFTGTPDTYRPGEDTAGLTAQLERDVPGDHPPVTFTDVTRAAGIDVRHFTGRRTSQLPEDMGSGAAWGDYDGDGWLDLYVANLAAPLPTDGAAPDVDPQSCNVLYHNEGDGTFTDVTEQAGVGFCGMAMAATWADYDGDGHDDLFVSAYGRNVLYHNDGDGTFTDVTEQAGLDGEEGFWAGASWADYDRDGDLDLYVTGYVRYEPMEVGRISRQYDVETPASINPSSFAPARNLLYHNEGDGTFTEVAWRTGVANQDGRSLAAAWVDLDDDGWLDLYVANDISDNVLYHNRGDGTFDDVSHRALVADYRGAMGIATGDWNGDADVDLFVTHWIAQENALYDNVGLSNDGQAAMLQFMDVADRYGLGQIALDHIGWGTSFFDYDNDGRLDLYVANGSTFQQDEAPHLLEAMPDRLYWNRDDEEGFYDVSSASGAYFDSSHVGRGAAFADYDNDGDVDVFVVNHGDRGVLLRNDGGNARSWLELRLEGSARNRGALGAHVRVVTEGQQQVRQVGAQAPYLSQNSRVVHVGLGSTMQVDTLEVRWPSGHRDVWTEVPANRIIQLREGGEVAL